MTLAAVRRGIERFENALRGMDEGAVEDGLNRCRHQLIDMRICFVSARPEGMTDGLFRPASLEPGFKLLSAEPVADPEAHIDIGCLCRETALGRANREVRKSPDGFGLGHGLRDGCAVPEPAAVAGATSGKGFRQRGTRRSPSSGPQPAQLAGKPLPCEFSDRRIVQSIESRGIERWHARNEVGAATALVNGAGTG